MKAFLSELRKSVLLTLLMAVMLCGAYPALVWAGGQALYPNKAYGSLFRDSTGTVRGSALIGQNFTSAKYFNSRPSAAGTGYDAANSSGTNLGPTSQKLRDSIKAAAQAYRTANGLPADAVVPADAVTSSASGLDPHISLTNARLQAVRVARERKMPLPALMGLIEKHTEDRDLGVLGEPRINIVILNATLDGIAL